MRRTIPAIARKVVSSPVRAAISWSLTSNRPPSVAATEYSASLPIAGSWATMCQRPRPPSFGTQATVNHPLAVGATKLRQVVGS